jgi:hypothetical protein
VRRLLRALKKPLPVRGVSALSGAPVRRPRSLPSRRDIPPTDLCERDADIHRLSSRGGEPLHYDAVGPGREGPPNPFAALVCPVNLQLGAFEIDRAQIVLDRRGFRKIQTHRECQGPAEPASRRGMGALVPFVVSEFAASWYFPSSSICRTCGKIPAMLGASKGLCGMNRLS